MLSTNRVYFTEQNSVVAFLCFNISSEVNLLFCLEKKNKTLLANIFWHLPVWSTSQKAPNKRIYPKKYIKHRSDTQSSFQCYYYADTPRAGVTICNKCCVCSCRLLSVLFHVHVHAALIDFFGNLGAQLRNKLTQQSHMFLW